MDVLHNIVLLMNYEQVTDLGFAGIKKVEKFICFRKRH